jgi:hypothetical protein
VLLAIYFYFFLNYSFPSNISTCICLKDLSSVELRTTEKENLAKNFENLRIGKPERVGPIQIHALYSTKVSSAHQVPQKHPSVGHATELATPRINQININNQSDSPLFLPEGWIIQGLQQSRALCEDIFVEAHMEVRVNVVCIERNRWSAPSTPSLDQGRIPISVIAAMRSVPNIQTVDDLKLRQNRVWESVTRQESRTGKRPTNSLTQVLREDSRHSEIAGHFSQLSELSQRVGGESGVLVTLNGEPLFAEIFQSAELFAQNYISLIQSVAFDVADSKRSQISKSAVSQFLSEVLNTPRTTERLHSGLRTSAGISRRAVDVRSSSQLQNHDMDFLHLLAINQRHGALQHI